MRRFLAAVALLFVYAAPVPAPTDNSVTYLRDHAGDTVKWQPWGKVALDQARQEDKPIALVVGSFAPHSSRTAHIAIESDAPVVNLLNGSFVPVLLDRSELPAIAAAYAAASTRSDTQDLVIYLLTPELEWLGVTSPDANLRSELESTTARWHAGRDAFLDDARLKVRRLRAQLTIPRQVPADPLAETLSQLLKRSNAARRTADPAGLRFLLRMNRDRGSSLARENAITTLQAIDRSALHDALGGGFYRAVRDPEWQMPFFDKSLEDQAELANVFLDAWQMLGNPRYADVARTTLEYAVRDLQMRSGAFNASQQADSLTPIGRPVIVEGIDYLWEQPEILHTFGPKMGARLSERFGVAATGNIPQSFDPEHAFEGKNLLRAVNIEPPDDATAAAVAKMLDIRLKRPAPRRDDPIAASNGLIVSALARGGAALADDHFVRAAVSGGAFIARVLYDAKTKQLFRRSGIVADADDYACVVDAFIELYEATLDWRWLDLAIDLQGRQDELFWRGATIGYEGGKPVPDPVRDFVITPVALAPLNSLSAENLIRLAAITGRDELRQRAEAIVAAYSSVVEPETGRMAMQLKAPVTRVIIFGRISRDDTVALTRAARSAFDPMRLLIHGGEAKRPAPKLVAIGNLQPNVDGTPSAYVCRSTGCSGALSDPQALAAALR